MVVGIDEAGLSPVLGPLVVSAVAMRVPDDQVDTPLWDVLAGAVSRKRSSKSALAINDSKKLYSSRSKGGLRALERGVLASLASAGREAASPTALLQLVASEAVGKLARYPWYVDDTRSLPRSAEGTDIVLAGNALKKAMSESGVALVGMRSEPIFAGQFNDLVGVTRNKASTLFDIVSRLLVWARGVGQDRLCVYVDRLGGRQRYREGLERVFDGCSLRVLTEEPECSAYEISDGRRDMSLTFSVGGDAKQLPVALASMLSKYIRELYMELLNGFWRGHLPELAPTAGYHTDGRRFWQEIEPTVRRLGIDPHLLFRTR